MARVVRKQKPPDLTDYKKYKPFLRLDFEHRCAYCHIPELRYGTPGNFAVDHFRPRSKFRSLLCQYSNLFYACRDCNLYKGSTWPDAESAGQFVDPCEVDLFRQWAATEDGRLVANNAAAAYMIDELRLNRPFLLEFRRRKTLFMIRVQRLESMLAATPIVTWTSVKGQDLLDTLNRELLDEFGDFWTALN